MMQRKLEMLAGWGCWGCWEMLAGDPKKPLLSGFYFPRSGLRIMYKWCMSSSSLVVGFAFQGPSALLRNARDAQPELPFGSGTGARGGAVALVGARGCDVNHRSWRFGA